MVFLPSEGARTHLLRHNDGPEPCRTSSTSYIIWYCHFGSMPIIATHLHCSASMLFNCIQIMQGTIASECTAVLLVEALCQWPALARICQPQAASEWSHGPSPSQLEAHNKRWIVSTSTTTLRTPITYY
jgi:hypothetical protein